MNCVPVAVEVGRELGEEKGPPRPSMVRVKLRLNVPIRDPSLGGSESLLSST
jgi:hypothetical protein